PTHGLRLRDRRAAVHRHPRSHPAQPALFPLQRGSPRHRMKPRFPWLIHLVLLGTAVLTLAPFAFMVNNAFRSTPEFYHGFFALPAAAKGLVQVSVHTLTGDDRPLTLLQDDGSAL